MIARFSASLTCFFALIFANAQEKWDLERCIRHAQENNLQVKEAWVSQKISENLHKQAKADLFPSFNASTSYGFNFGRSVDPTTYTFVNRQIQTSSVSLTSNVTLLNGMRKLNIVRQTNYDALASMFATEDIANNISLSITQAFLQILLSSEEMKKAEERLSLSAQQVEQTKKLFDAGVVPEGSLYDVTAQQAGDSLAFIIARNSVELGKLNLALLLQLENPAGFDVEIPEVKVTPPTVLIEQNPEGIFTFARNNQASVKSADFSLKGAERRWFAAKGWYYPSLSFFYTLRTNYSSQGQRLVSNTFLDNPVIGYFDAGGTTTFVNSIEDFTVPQYEDATFLQQYNENIYQTLGFSLDIPIFNGLQTRISVKNAELQYLRAKYSFKAVEDKLRTDVYAAYADVKAAYQKYRAAQNSVSALEKSFEYVTKKFNLGAATTLEYSTSGTNLANAQNELIKSKYEYIFKLKVLDYYLGNPITLN